MRYCLALARRGGTAVRPNPVVGAVVVRDQRIVGRGYHRIAGGPHAEIEALAEAGALAAGATLYVTLEPCNHQGRTGPCTKAILDSGITSVICAMLDPNPLVAGGGLNYLKSAGVHTSHGVLEDQARELNRYWIDWTVTKNVYCTGVLCLTVDGKTTNASGLQIQPGRGPAARFLSKLRCGVHAHAPATKDSPAVPGIECVRLPVDLEDFFKQGTLATLGEKGVQSLLVEDPRLIELLLKKRHLRRLVVFRSAEVSGRLGTMPFHDGIPESLGIPPLSLIYAKRCGQDVISLYEPNYC